MTGSQIKRVLTDLIESFILDNNEGVLDDDLSDILYDREQRDEAIDDLIRYIKHNREDL